MKSIGELTISESIELLNPIAILYGLKLYKISDLKLARLILANLYYQELVCEFYGDYE